jgi:hypothetical protein
MKPLQKHSHLFLAAYLLLPLAGKQLSVLVASGERLHRDEVVGQSADRPSSDARQNCTKEGAMRQRFSTSHHISQLGM